MTDVSILGWAAVRGDPGGLDRVASFLRGVAVEVDAVDRSLAACDVAAAWQGAAAEAFRGVLGSTPEDLAKAAASYGIASDAVGRYARELHASRDAAQRFADRKAELDGRRAGATATARAARRDLDQARIAALTTVDPLARASAQRQLDGRMRQLAAAETQLARLSGEIRTVEQQAQENRRRLDAVGRSTREDLERASHAGLRNSPLSMLDRHGVSLASAWGVIVVVGRTAREVLDDTLDLGHAFMAFVHDQNWDTFDRLLTDLDAALWVVGLAAYALVVVVTGGAALVALPLVLEALTIASTAVSVIRLGTDIYRAGTGDTSVTGIDIGVDIIGLLPAAKAIKPLRSELRWWVAAHRAEPGKWRDWAYRMASTGGGRPVSYESIRRNSLENLRDHVKDGIVSKGLGEAADEAEWLVGPPVGRSDRAGVPPASVCVTHTRRIPAVAR